jgi:2'-5' RNA ligase
MKPPDLSWRLFIAIELPAILRRRVQDHIDQLRKAVPEARASWTPEEKLHLTLKFLGDTPVTKVDDLAQAVARAATRVSPFEVMIGACGAFPTRGQPRVLWIGIEDPTDALTKLHHALEDECANAGFPPEARRFHPHLTIARLRQPHDARRLAKVHKETGFDPVKVNVRDACLIRSELRSEGSRYTVISRHEFSGKLSQSV